MLQLRPHDRRPADDAVQHVLLDHATKPQRVGVVGEPLARHPGTDDLWGVHRRNPQVADQ